MLSQLPILSGTDVLLFFIGPGTADRGGDSQSGFCYANGLWEPICLPFRGKYEDSDAIVLPKSPPTHWEQTKKDLEDLNFTWFDDRYKDTTQPEPLPIEWTEDFFLRVERAWVRGKSGVYGYRPDRTGDNRFPLGQVMIRQDVWDAISAIRIPHWRNRIEGKPQPAYDYLTEATEYVNWVMAYDPAPKRFFNPYDVEEHFQDKDWALIDAFRWSTIGFMAQGYRGAIDFRLQAKEYSRDLAIEIYREIGEISHVCRVMNSLRKAWAPQQGKGSQSTEEEYHQQFHQSVADIAGKMISDQEY